MGIAMQRELQWIFKHCNWRGTEATKLITINGLRWPVSTNGTHIQIGCKNHTVEQWEQFDDAQIARMDLDALAFWREFKPTIMATARYRATLNVEGEVK